MSAAESTVMIALNEALGQEILDALKDPATQDIAVKSNGLVLIRKNGKFREFGHMDEERRETVVLLAAHFAGRSVRSDKSSLAAILPNSNARLQGNVPPAVKSASFTLRRPAPQLFSLERYVADRIITQSQCDFLSSVAGKATIAVGGPIGGGKSTLVNGLIHLPGFQELNMIVVQDDDELEPPRWAEKLFTNHTCTPPHTLQYCVEDTLRMMTEVLVVGEVRSGEARPLIDACTTGLKAIFTIHILNARAIWKRLTELFLRTGAAPSLHDLYRAVQVVVFIQQRPDGTRKVEEIVSVEEDGDGGWVMRQVA